MAKTQTDRVEDEAANPLNELDYEAALAQLEAIIVRLESGELPLEMALANYEEGAALAAYCERQLAEAELRVRKWRPGGDDGGETEEFV